MIIKNLRLKKSNRSIPVQLLAWLLLMALGTGIASSLLLRNHKIQQSHATVDIQSPAFLSPAAPKTLLRAVYPYSVIPGGVRNIAELRNAIANDPIVSTHYRDFQLTNLRVVRLDRPRLLHVSYRIGDRIYWTKRRMKFAKGETVITDGVRMARTRCGNLAADIVPDTDQPLTLFTEPTAEALDTPVNSSGAEIPTEALPLESLLISPADSLALAVESSPSSGGATTGASGPGGSTGSPGTPGGTRPSGPAGVVPVPEPGTLLQLTLGLIAIGLLRKFAAPVSTINPT
jgi:PEP-CTERM motif